MDSQSGTSSAQGARKPFRQRLFIRISFVFFVLILILIGVVVFLVPFAGKRIQDFAQQLGLKDVAQKISLELQRELPPDPTAWDIQQAGLRISGFMPSNGIFLVQKDGTLLMTLSDRTPSTESKIEVAPIEEFLRSDHPDNLPIYGDDVRGGKEVFSAARLKLPHFDGYVYVTLGLSSSALFAARRETLTVLILMVGIPFLLLLFAGFAFWAFSRITRRLHRLLSVVENFESGDRAARTEDPRVDEIGELGRSFDRMADTISANISEIERRDRVRRELVASIAHDLRRPIVHLSARCEALEDNPGTLDIPAFARGLRKQASALNRMLSDLLELAKIDIGEDNRELIPIEIDSLAFESLGAFTSSAEDRGITLSVDVPDEIPLVRGDPFQLGRVFANLLENAIRHTERGGSVCIRLRRGERSVNVAVLDSGTGISPERMNEIFEPFIQGDSESGEGETGISGLGLAIVRRIVEGHGSSISVQNRPEGGTEFSFELKTSGAR